MAKQYGAQAYARFWRSVSDGKADLYAFADLLEFRAEEMRLENASGWGSVERFAGEFRRFVSVMEKRNGAGKRERKGRSKRAAARPSKTRGGP